MSESTAAAPEAPPALPARLDDRPAFLTRDRPLIDELPDRWIEYLAHTVAQVEDAKQAPIMRAEIGMFVELCASYGLDPFAKEAWLAKSKRGKLLVMVGRDGLRKIAQRNGLHVDGDVVCAKDDFKVVRTRDGNRTVEHSYGNPTARGEIVGAWAEVREGGPMGRPMGYYYAPLGEYLPANVSDYSPWKKQVGVMILAAAERQSIRQATPLGGLLVEGENESATATATGYAVAAVGEQPEGLPVELRDLVERAQAIDGQRWRAIEVAARVPAPDAEDYADAVTSLVCELQDWLAEHGAYDPEPTDAEVVDAEPVAADEPSSGVEPRDVSEALQEQWRADAQWREQVGPMLHRYADLENSLDEAVADGRDSDAEQLRAELDKVEGDLDALGVPVGWVPESDDVAA